MSDTEVGVVFAAITLLFMAFTMRQPERRNPHIDHQRRHRRHR